MSENLARYLKLLNSIQTILFGKNENTNEQNLDGYFKIEDLNESLYGYMNKTLNIFNLICNWDSIDTATQIETLSKLYVELKHQFSDFLGFDLEILIKEYSEFLKLMQSHLQKGSLKSYYNETKINKKRDIVMNFLAKFCQGDFGLSVFNFFYQMCWNMITTEAFVES